jgi:hypothetical protein
MQFKHTDGVWYISGSTNDSLVCADVAFKPGSEKTIAIINMHFGDESIANKRLIMAAPGMLRIIINQLKEDWNAFEFISGTIEQFRRQDDGIKNKIDLLEYITGLSIDEILK